MHTHTMNHSVSAVAARESWLEARYQWIVIAAASLIYLPGVLSPPSLMDDVDAVHATIARTMLQSGDWVTARLNGVVYLDKAPLTTWLAAASYAVFGVHDWAARIPIALSAVAVCWVTARFAAWGVSRRAGLCSGIALATCVGLFLFSRILIPEVMLALSSTIALWAFLQLLEREDLSGRGTARWVIALGASLGAGLLLKGLLGIVIPAGAGLVYLLLTRQLFLRSTWRKLRPAAVLGLALLIAAPWYVAAILANPPYFDFTLHSGPGHYRGFFWRYFINEHLLRYLNLRYPRDYNTVPRLPFWLLHLVWLYPWSFCFPAAARLSYRPDSRSGRVRLLALCAALFLLVFFTFSTTQEYYTMPIYPALALLAGSALADGQGWKWTRWGMIAAACTAFAAGVTALVIYYRVLGFPTPGDISNALTNNPEAYTLSLGHFNDLTLRAFAYLRGPLLIAGMAMLLGGVFALLLGRRADTVALAVMMIVVMHAARMALIVFDPYLSSHSLAAALDPSPPGRLIVNGEYYPFSSVFFYTGRSALLLNGRVNNLEYGSNAPGAPQVFIDDEVARELWSSPENWYMLCSDSALPRLRQLLGADSIHIMKESGGRALLANHALTKTSPPASGP